MAVASNETLLAFALWGVGAYFSVLVIRSLVRWRRFFSMRQAALVAWPAPTSLSRAVGFGIGSVAAGLAAFGLAQRASFHHIFSQATIALYFLAVAPLLARIRPGLYDCGIWTESAFARYDQIARWAFTDLPEIRLLIVVRGRGRALRLAVPAQEYGAVRKTLDQKARRHALRPDPDILDLSSPR